MGSKIQFYWAEKFGGYDIQCTAKYVYAPPEYCFGGPTNLFTMDDRDSKFSYTVLLSFKYFFLL